MFPDNSIGYCFHDLFPNEALDNRMKEFLILSISFDQAVLPNVTLVLISDEIT